MQMGATEEVAPETGGREKLWDTIASLDQIGGLSRKTDYWDST